MAKPKSKQYDADQIIALGSIGGIRAKPEMYISETGLLGIRHIAIEPIDNAIDEHLRGASDLLEVVMDPDGSCWVGDSGGGIPIEDNKQTKRSTFHTVFTEAHSGGKFGTEAYKEGSSGTHGVGITVTNALSEYLTASTFRDKKWWQLKFTKGESKSENPTQIKRPERPESMKSTGTIIHFLPDASIFDKGVNLIGVEKNLKEWMRFRCYLNPELVIQFTDSKGKQKKLQEPGGIQALVERRLKKAKLKSKHLLSLTNAKRGKKDEAPKFTLALALLEEGIGRTYAHTNTLENTAGGTHQTVLHDALHNALKKLERKAQFDPQDSALSMMAVINISLQQPKFSTQTKERLVEAKRGPMIQPEIEAMFTRYFKQNSKLAAKLIEMAKSRYTIRTGALKDRSLIKELNERAKAKTLLPGKLTLAPNAKPEQRELFLVEGDSAAGTAKLSRTGGANTVQEILALRGKVINAARADMSRITQNKEILALLTAVGWNPKHKHPEKEMRVKNKVLLLVDPDVDGAHINLLLLTAIGVLVPDLYRLGMVYLIKSPEYTARYKDQLVYGSSPEDIAEKTGTKLNALEYRHLKGWGEATPQLLQTVAFDTKHRELIQVNAAPADITEFLALMSTDIDRRRTLVGLDVDDLD